MLCPTQGQDLSNRYGLIQEPAACAHSLSTQVADVPQRISVRGPGETSPLVRPVTVPPPPWIHTGLRHLSTAASHHGGRERGTGPPAEQILLLEKKITNGHRVARCTGQMG